VASTGVDLHVIRPMHIRAGDEPLTLIVVDNYVQQQTCGLYSTHRCAILNQHHVCPESWWVHAGKDPGQSPFVTICPNCHMNTHCAIDALIKGQYIGHLPTKVRPLAREAFTIAEANGLTPTLTL
jgi:hypothetical protein